MSDTLDNTKTIPGSIPVYAGPPARQTRTNPTKQQAEIIGRNIREIRIQAGLSQNDLLALIGRKHRTWLSRIENGHQLISTPLLTQIARALNVEIDQLLAP